MDLLLYLLQFLIVAVSVAYITEKQLDDPQVLKAALVAVAGFWVVDNVRIVDGMTNGDPSANPIKDFITGDGYSDTAKLTQVDNNFKVSLRQQTVAQAALDQRLVNLIKEVTSQTNPLDENSPKYAELTTKLNSLIIAEQAKRAAAFIKAYNAIPKVEEERSNPEAVKTIREGNDMLGDQKEQESSLQSQYVQYVKQLYHGSGVTPPPLNFDQTLTQALQGYLTAINAPDVDISKFKVQSMVLRLLTHVRLGFVKYAKDDSREAILLNGIERYNFEAVRLTVPFTELTDAIKSKAAESASANEPATPAAPATPTDGSISPRTVGLIALGVLAVGFVVWGFMRK